MPKPKELEEGAQRERGALDSMMITMRANCFCGPSFSRQKKN
jgi:hypothetical protein